MSNGLAVGIAIPSAILLWPERPIDTEANGRHRGGLPESTERSSEPAQSSEVTGTYAATPGRTVNSPPPWTTTHEYRMKVSKSGYFLTFAVLFIVASIPVATREIGYTGTPIALGRILIATILLFSGAFMVAMFARSRLILEESQIRYRVVFREEVFPVSEIEGFRTITTGPPSQRVSRRVICVRGRRKPIETAPYGPDEFLQTWLQQSPSLDQRDQV